MAEKLGEAVLELRTDDAALDRGIRSAEGKAAALSDKFNAFGQRAMAAGSRLSLAITAPLTILAKKSIDAAREQEKAVASVEAALGSMGDRAGFTSQQLQAMASELQRNSLFGDEQILQKVTANLLTFGNVSGEVFERAQQGALDLSARLGTDLQGSAVMLGKALNDPVKGIAALTRVGVSFTAQQKEQIKAMAEAGDIAGAQAIILSELEKQYGGQALAAAKADGGITQLANSWGDFQEQIGSVLIEFMQPLISGLGSLVSWLQSLDENTRKWVVGIGIAAAVLGPLLMVLGLMASGIAAVIPLFAALGAVSLPVVAIVAAIAAAGALIYANWDKIGPMLSSLAARFNEALGPRIQALIETVKQVLTELWEGPLGELVRMAISALGDFQSAYIGVLGEGLMRILSGALELVTSVFRQIGNILDFVGKLLTGDFAGAWAAAKRIVAENIRGMLAVVGALFPEIEGYLSSLYTAAKEWLQKRLGAVFDYVGNKVKQVTGAFRDMYIAVVGNSYVPDMVDELGDEAQRFVSQFVKPMLAGVGQISDAFASLEAPSLDPATGSIPFPGDDPEFDNSMRDSFSRTFSDGIRAALNGDLRGFLDRFFTGILDNAFRGAMDQLGGALFGNGGSGGLLGALFSGGKSFAGMFASGGNIPSGSWGIVGERGAEAIRATPSGIDVMPNSALREMVAQPGGGTTVSIPITIDATGADPAAIERVRSELARLREELPERIVRTVQDASDRRMISMGGGM